MILREVIEQRNKLLADARALMAGNDVTAETRSKVDAMLSDAQALKSDIERLEVLAESESRSADPAAPPREQIESTETDERTYEQRNRATNIAFRKYLKGERFEQRDLTVAADGGVMLPVAALPPVQAQRSAGQIYDIVKHLRTSTGEDVRVPLWDDTSQIGVLDSTPVGTGTDPNITGVTIKTDGLRMGDPMLIDNKLRQDLDYDLIADVNQAMQQRYLRTVSQFITSGNSSAFTGITSAADASVTTAAVGVIAYDDLVDVTIQLDPSYAAGACWSMSQTTLGTIRKIVDSNGRPIFLPFMDGAIQGAGNSGYAGMILGFPVKINQFMPAVATGNVPIIFGDHTAYTLREVKPGLVIKQSSQRWMELNRLGVVAFARAGGAPTVANTTTYNPLQALKVQ